MKTEKHEQLEADRKAWADHYKNPTVNEAFRAGWEARDKKQIFSGIGFSEGPCGVCKKALFYLNEGLCPDCSSQPGVAKMWFALTGLVATFETNCEAGWQQGKPDDYPDYAFAKEVVTQPTPAPGSGKDE